MQFEICDVDSAHQVKKLFTEVFTESEGRVEGKLIGELASELQETTDPSDIFSFIAKDGDTIVGCIILARITFETPVDAFILSPVAVATDYQRQGLGKKLIRFGLEYLKSKDVELVFTYGDPDFYSKVGFQQITEDVAKAPYKLSQPEGWLAQHLDSDKIEPIKGGSTCVKALSRQIYW